MATKPSHILGMNARQWYTKTNSKESCQFGFSKLKSKELLARHHIPTPRTLHVFESIQDLDNINWELVPVPFVVKPASGSAGKGIWSIKKKLKNKSVWVRGSGEHVTASDLNLHVGNILDGEYSTWGSNYRALIEEFISGHPALAKYSYRGTPDIRVVVFNSVPVMAMARIPSKASDGRANLDQGALGIGIDIATGITTYGISGKSGRIKYFPGSKRKVNGIKIPQWSKVLEMAVKAAIAANYNFMGADMFIHQENGPMVVELNGFPGLSIQLANNAGLKRRLERVEGLEVRDAGHGVKIGQALFAESFADEILSQQTVPVVGLSPELEVFADNNKPHATTAIVDTKRSRSIISEQFADSLGLLDLDDLLFRQQEKLEGRLPVIGVKFKLQGKVVTTAMVASKRLNRTKHQIELGRRDLQGFLIGQGPIAEPS
ncbi:MAG: hypothetical protein COU69_03695 [Candidatus Pacebacteria bacterium CG10_big_fil_rev_8_21_14_0_10_56_10]|nr:MAG: hypothetical protein COU69_03695 [Candidatus Pacebacteria bacterium CG10_big_fil_rev_8_21_14_0_10_56_10]